MDFLRSCYRSQMRLFSDRPDVLTWGRWFFCPPDAKLVPYLHKFGSSVWDDDKSLDDPPLGEVKGYRRWTNGVLPPQYTGTHFCGDTAWTEGILYADRPGLEIGLDGFPTCCPHDPVHRAFVGLGGHASAYRAVMVAAQIGLTASVQSGIQWHCVTTRPMPKTLVVRASVVSGGTCLTIPEQVTATFDPAAGFYKWGLPTALGVCGQGLDCTTPNVAFQVTGSGLIDNLAWTHGATTLVSLDPFHVTHLMTSNGNECTVGTLVQLDITES